MVNKAIIVGRLTKDSELKQTQSGTAICSFSIATSEKYRDKNGEQIESTEFHNIKAWQKLAEICGKYLKKGSLVYIEGKLSTSNWEKDGVKHYKTEIVASDMKMLGGKNEANHAPQTNSFDVPSTDFEQDDLPF